MILDFTQLYSHWNINKKHRNQFFSKTIRQCYNDLASLRGFNFRNKMQFLKFKKVLYIWVCFVFWGYFFFACIYVCLVSLEVIRKGLSFKWFWVTLLIPRSSRIATSILSHRVISPSPECNFFHDKRQRPKTSMGGIKKKKVLT